MRKLKTYNLFLESFQKDIAVMHEYSIYDWFEDLKSDNRRPSNIQRHKIWTEHFVGDGWWDKITSHVDRIFEVLSEVNIRHIKDAMLEVFDKLRLEEKRRVMRIEILDEVEEWAANLAYSQFTELEMRNGYAWSILNENSNHRINRIYR